MSAYNWEFLRRQPPAILARLLQAQIRERKRIELLAIYMSNIPMQIDQLTKPFRSGESGLKSFLSVLQAAGLDEGVFGPIMAATPPERSSGEVMKDVFEIVAMTGKGRG